MPRRREPVPTIVAEALIDLPDPLCGILNPGPVASLEQVRASLVRSVAPVEADVVAPGWLRPEQAAPFRRAIAAIQRYRGVLLADPVGSGKTYIALAVANALGHPTVAIVPASLKEQWRRCATELGLSIGLHSHESLSRGRLPDGPARFVIVDESHRFRTSGIRRYRELARWLVGRRVMLLSGTPVVNTLQDLANQLRLGIRDDALVHRGVPGIAAMLERNEVTGALGDIVLCRPRLPEGPQKRESELEWSRGAIDQEILESIDRMVLSSDRGIAALIRMTLWRALASSRPALAGALSRYAGLLDHAAQASTLGRSVTRHEIRTFTGGALDQLVMWEVLPTLYSPADLVLDDRGSLNRLIDLLKRCEPDPRILKLKALLQDGEPTLVFTSSRDTLDALRSVLSDLRPAWVSGSGSGIGQVHMDRELVLDHFRPTPSPAPPASPALLATDLAAEGLNLQRARRIVHFDLPWTSVRVDQREGRAVRLGSAHREVEIVRFSPWNGLEDRLRQVERLIAKRKLATHAGLADDGSWLYRWRAELPSHSTERPVAGVARAQGSQEGWLIGLALDLVFADGTSQKEPASLMWVHPDGTIVEDPEFVVERLAELREGEDAGSNTPPQAGEIIVEVARERLHRAQHTSWLSQQAPLEHRRLVRRMRRVAADAARQRDPRMLALADSALDWLSGGVTAGEAALISELLELSSGKLLVAWQPLLRNPRQRPIPVPRLCGVIGCRASMSSIQD